MRSSAFPKLLQVFFQNICPAGWARAVLLLCAVASPAQTFKTLVNLGGINGGDPMHSSLVQGFDGSYYGTTFAGGNLNACDLSGCGTVFKITATGKLTTLYTFCAQGCPDGSSPSGGLVEATDGNFYGTTAYGDNAFGTVFKITASGKLTTIHRFANTDGAFPFASLVEATDGNFYGTTYEGGANGLGTIFRITPQGKLTTLHSFCQQSNCSDGSYVIAGLVQATDGNFYGATAGGGSTLCSPSPGCGTLFKITPSGTLTTIYTFCKQTGCSDGSYPEGGLVQAVDGNFYGTTLAGGTGSCVSFGGGCGTLFKITSSGTLTTLHSFVSTDGAFPIAGLVQATNRRFYGTTTAGGSNSCPVGCGTAFEIRSSGTLTVLHSFNGKDGTSPEAELVQSTSGKFYGTTYSGGTGRGCEPNSVGCGTAFSLSVGLRPFVETLPTSGHMGTKVVILGTNLTGATSVSFNGDAATFTVVSKSEIKTSVPAGATTGKVKVVTPHGTLSSNVVFKVTH